MRACTLRPEVNPGFNHVGKKLSQPRRFRQPGQVLHYVPRWGLVKGGVGASLIPGGAPVPRACPNRYAQWPLWYSRETQPGWRQRHPRRAPRRPAVVQGLLSAQRHEHLNNQNPKNFPYDPCLPCRCLSLSRTHRLQQRSSANPVRSRPKQWLPSRSGLRESPGRRASLLCSGAGARSGLRLGHRHQQADRRSADCRRR